MPTENQPSPRCHKCGNDDVINTAVQQKLRSHGQLKLHVEMRCEQCGNVWWSRNKKALKEAALIDKDWKDSL